MDPAVVTARNLMGTFVSVSVMRHGREDQGKGEEISPRSDYNKVEIYKRAARNFNGNYRTMLYVYTWWHDGRNVVIDVVLCQTRPLSGWSKRY